jgi:hypothetical protein
MHRFIEETVGRPVQTIEMADHKFMEQLKEKLRPQIIKLIEGEGE